MDVRLDGRRLLVDGRPSLLRSGEIHYFRLDRSAWRSRLAMLREAGADTVSTYVPWVVHEDASGAIDLHGARRDELDLGAFLDEAAAAGLRAIVRPGPFTMGELRHEGVPARVLADHPELRPVGWDGTLAPTDDLDVAAPSFLAEADRWYAALGPVLAPRTAPAGGPVVAVQLDNEVGMLAWVSNTPPLTDDALRELAALVGGAAPWPPADAPLHEWASIARTPPPKAAPRVRLDVARLARIRSARYVDALAASAVRHGFGGVPMAVNVHGTGAAGARDLGIGIGQLEAAFRDRPGRFAGSDHYVGALDFAAAAEFDAAHALLAAAAPGQPLASLEHEAGSGDYAGDLAAAVPPEAVELKTRLLLARGVRVLNWYLFAGGVNRVDPRPEDTEGSGHRFGITGARHGAAAPVTPEGERSPSFDATARSMRLVAEHEPDAAVWEPETDGVRLAWVPSQWATESVHPADRTGRALVDELAWGRGSGPGGLLARMLAAAAVRYDAVELGAGPPGAVVLVLGTGDVLDDRDQAAVVEHLQDGGGLLLQGDLPVRVGEGRAARRLADALGVEPGRRVVAGPGVLPALRGTRWAADLDEVRCGRLTHLSGGEPVLLDAGSGAPCGVEVAVGRGRAVVIAADGPGRPAFYRRAIERLGAVPSLELEGALPGLLLGTTRTPDGRRFLHLVNTAGWPQRVVVRDRGRGAAGTALGVPARSGRIVPLT